MSPLISVAAIVMLSGAVCSPGATSRGVVRLPVPKSENIATSNGTEIDIHLESGYTDVDNNASRSMGSQLVDVEINKFWSWMNFGF